MQPYAHAARIGVLFQTFNAPQITLCNDRSLDFLKGSPSIHTAASFYR
jgi:hypothetical protein